MPLPDPTEPFPVTLPDGTRHPGTVFLKPLIDHPRFEVGEYTYASDFDPPSEDGWAGRLAPYLFPFSREKIVIGKFAQIAHGVRLISSSANHEMRGPSTYPFKIFDPDRIMSFQPDTRDITIGHDVWLGNGVQVLPGAQIGHGVIAGAGAVIRGTVPDYAIVAGNPAEVIRMRFSEAEIATLLDIAWWDWPPDRITAAMPLLEAGEVAALALA